MRPSQRPLPPQGTDLYHGSLNTINAAYTLQQILLHRHFKIINIKLITRVKLKSQGNLSDCLEYSFYFYYGHRT